MIIELHNGQKVKIVPVVTGTTDGGTKLLGGKVVDTGRYCLWHQNTSNPDHPHWTFMRAYMDLTDENLVADVSRMCYDVCRVKTRAAARGVPPSLRHLPEAKPSATPDGERQEERLND